MKILEIFIKLIIVFVNVVLLFLMFEAARWAYHLPR